ncbi:microtubule-associated protein Jupiter isoform X8 [Drosophila gunungcola]|uniref:microtubule-associated protein Jupiter isoform X9 n=1 Tax=Drosophila elegans TaxID=30023 RepID=UPI001BC84B3F|nr:microtubule-associated protein Jupiter isoform X9 [Drosophila elegans]XP_052838048.1 microtubule-associated protein Jupiter isoform X8 [Drosophila gunungcola]
MISNFDCTDNQASSKVLRPPGGGSSDIFGSEMPQTPRNVKNRMVSNIFAAEKDNGVKNNGDAPRRGQKTVDSHSRLFGEPSRPITPGKNHMKSSIPFGGQNSEAAAAQKLLTTNGHYNGKSGSVSSASSSVSSSTENLKMNNGSRSVFRNMSKGNPVTGEGYKAGGNDFHQRQESSNGGTPVINKNRVPPGGYSSGLW